MPWLPAFAALLATLVINEILFDPPGPDTGYEFVELFNPGPAPVSLDGFELLFLNGSDPDPPDVVWSGDPATLLPAGAFFVIGEDQVETRDRTARLGLQNGDEALLLAHADEVVDAVAWGVDLGLGEGAPAEGGHGHSLGRVPDAADTGSNRADFVALPRPNPGAPNLAAEQFDLVRWWTEPVWREEAGPLLLRLRFVATGWAPHQEAVVEVWGARSLLQSAAGDTLEVRAERWVDPGPVETGVGVLADGVERTVGPSRIWCGVGAVAMVEVQPRPADNEPEWVELLNRSDQPVDLAAWSLRDRGGPVRRVGSTVTLPPGQRIVLTADAPALRAHYADEEIMCLEPAGGWPTLNDTDPGAGVAADSLHLIGPTGEVVDLVTWRRAGIEERGRPLQRSRIEVGRASVWLPSVDAPSPGAAGAAEGRQWPRDGMSCRPDPFTPDGDGEGDHLEILLDRAVVGAIRIHDLQGDVVRELEVVQAGWRAAARWDGTDARGRPVPPGAWVVVAETTDPPGLRRQVVGLGRAW